MLAYGELLAQFRRRANLSQRALAKAVGVDPSYINRLEHGERQPPASNLTRALTAALKLDPTETDILVFSGGGLPAALEKLHWPDRTIVALADVLADPSVPLDEINDLRQIIELLLRRYVRHQPIIAEK
ncbi:MAG: helix-turn-helix domain-containing protein [Chloroflexi bacterium]|nr:helix-turn-helix domain-containing protein [Chloroflexota bacterium]